jgi:hypothetical protein
MRGRNCTCGKNVTKRDEKKRQTRKELSVTVGKV